MSFSSLIYSNRVKTLHKPERHEKDTLNLVIMRASAAAEIMLDYLLMHEYFDKSQKGVVVKSKSTHQ